MTDTIDRLADLPASDWDACCLPDSFSCVMHS